jgi:hypothetical protein
MRASPNPVIPVTVPARSAEKRATSSAQLNKATSLDQRILKLEA